AGVDSAVDETGALLFAVYQVIVGPVDELAEISAHLLLAVAIRAPVRLVQRPGAVQRKVEAPHRLVVARHLPDSVDEAHGPVHGAADRDVAHAWDDEDVGSYVAGGLVDRVDGGAAHAPGRYLDVGGGAVHARAGDVD